MSSNNPSNVSCTKNDEHFVLTVLWIVGGYSSVLTCVLGFFTNIFSIVVLSTKRLRKLSTNIYLIALAIVNLIWLILFFIFYAFRLTIIVPNYLSENHEHPYSIYQEFFQRSSPYIFPLMNTCQLCIIYYTVAVSIDRYFYVFLGLNTNNYCTVRNALRMITISTILAIIFILPHWFKHSTILWFDAKNRTRYRLSYTDLGEQRMFRELIDIYLYIPIVHVIPILALIIINSLTIRRLVKYQDEHRRLLSKPMQQWTTIRTNLIHSRRHFHGTVMLLGIVLLFLLCRIPMLIDQMYKISDLINHHHQSNSHRCRIQRIFSICANFLQTINSNGNLVIYLLFYRNFRETSKELLKILINYIRLSIYILFTRNRSRASTHSTEI